MELQKDKDVEEKCTNKQMFQTLIWEKGVKEAESERERKKSAFLDEYGLDDEKLEKLLDDLRMLHEDFEGACERVISTAQADAAKGKKATLPSSAKEEDRARWCGDSMAGSPGTQTDWVLQEMRKAGGSLWAPDIYDRWERGHGGKRKSIQTAVSTLVSGSGVIKGEWEVRDGRRGCWLHLDPDCERARKLATG